MGHKNRRAKNPKPPTTPPSNDEVRKDRPSSNTETHIGLSLAEDNYEVPTPPPTPKLTPKALAITRLVPSSVQQRKTGHSSPVMSSQLPKLKLKPKPTAAHEPKCAICLTDLSSNPFKARVAHFEDCWKILHARVVPPKLPIPTSQRDEESSRTNTDPEDYDSFVSDPSVAPKDIPPTHCLRCAESLVHLDDITVFHHRFLCIQHPRPLYCPICTQVFMTEGQFWKPMAVLWHLHNCQHGDALGPIEEDNWDALEMAWQGRQKTLHAAMLRNFGDRKHWTSYDHRNSVRGKKLFGHMIGGDDTYATDPTPLRAKATNLLEGGMMESLAVRNEELGGVLMEKFRRGRFAVLDLPGKMQVPEGFEAELIQVYEFPAIAELDADEVQKELLALLKATTLSKPTARRAPSPPGAEGATEAEGAIDDYSQADAKQHFTIFVDASIESESAADALTVTPRTPSGPSSRIPVSYSPAFDNLIAANARSSSPNNAEGRVGSNLDSIDIDHQGYQNAIAANPELLDATPSGIPNAVTPAPRPSASGHDSHLGRWKPANNPVNTALLSKPTTALTSTFPPIVSNAVSMPPPPVMNAPQGRPNFLCTDDSAEYVEVETYYYPPRGAIPVSLRSSIRTVLDPNLTWEEQSRRNRAMCIFGGVDELLEE